MKRSLWDRFASKLDSADDAPEPLRSALLASLSGGDFIRVLVFGPATKTANKCSPASLLAVLDDGWLVVSGTEEQPPQVARVNFADTLSVELTNILLFGRLKIEFVAEGRPQSVAIEFNTVMERLYQQAVQLLLEGMDGVSAATPSEEQPPDEMLSSLPLKFRNAVLEFRPASQRVLAVLHWPAVLGGQWRWFQRELAPEAVAVLTERELIFISEERSWSWLWIGRVNKYGNVVTYCPLSRLEQFRIVERDSLCALEVGLRAQSGEGHFQIDFPCDQEPVVARFMEKAMTQRSPVAV